MSTLFDAFERAYDAADQEHKTVLRELFGHYCDALIALENAAARIHAIDPRYAHGVKSRADDIARYGSRHLLALAGLPDREPRENAEPR